MKATLALCHPDPRIQWLSDNKHQAMHIINDVEDTVKETRQWQVTSPEANHVLSPIRIISSISAVLPQEDFPLPFMLMPPFVCRISHIRAIHTHQGSSKKTFVLFTFQHARS
jgi:hypothetical protein